ncbi:putative phosphoprotein [Zahedan rhabdovirus]|uniref:Putative phosphoprotein n=1 Tax=Zahedan rhabdovirus TaxID=1620507 RepID=A0A0R6CGJ3_9RHAB|nr:putative phosphoprotein [Zahedan rhabdovirus]AJR16765.1 putative phosphoprotein [Zahedan rhabdovirus]
MSKRFRVPSYDPSRMVEVAKAADNAYENEVEKDKDIPPLTQALSAITLTREEEARLGDDSYLSDSDLDRSDKDDDESTPSSCSSHRFADSEGAKAQFYRKINFDRGIEYHIPEKITTPQDAIDDLLSYMEDMGMIDSYRIDFRNRRKVSINPRSTIPVRDEIPEERFTPPPIKMIVQDPPKADTGAIAKSTPKSTPKKVKAKKVSLPSSGKLPVYQYITIYGKKLDIDLNLYCGGCDLTDFDDKKKWYYHAICSHKIKGIKLISIDMN